jgi:hypothetical protein
VTITYLISKWKKLWSFSDIARNFFILNILECGFLPIHTYMPLTLYPWRGSRGISDYPLRHKTYYQNTLPVALLTSDRINLTKIHWLGTLPVRHSQLPKARRRPCWSARTLPRAAAPWARRPPSAPCARDARPHRPPIYTRILSPSNISLT